ncbi:MAG: DUF2092 domain-containing protein [Armatimonadota bacterium]|nr:DUF2092 domain-containing protein [bacterium]MCS7309334.1 DUF2092 domain-containing protein [Armatimonadota bacterium]MDW8103729.1 DUF2092 domain-containing protein [Armatimonadota bacterium]MDW8289740.1 DUF2092 domain-containing protein [Armatimonadota bacterium]
MKNRFCPWLVAGAVLLSAMPSHAQDVQAILTRVAEAYRNAKSYQAQATLTQTRQGGGQQQRRSSTISTKYKAPNKVVTILQGNETMQVYSDGKTMYIYSPKEKQYMKMPAPASLAQMPGMSGVGSGDPTQIGAQLQAIFANGKKLADRNVGGKPAFVLQSTQSQQSQDGKTSFQLTATAFIDKATYLLRQLSIQATRSQGAQKVVETITVNFASQQINPNLPDSVFAFKPPAGAKEVTPPQPSGATPAPR